MKFNLTTTADSYRSEKLPALEKLGFKFKYEGIQPGRPFKKIEPKVISLEINSLEELVEFSKEWGEVVLDGDTIEIYDDYRE